MNNYCICCGREIKFFSARREVCWRCIFVSKACRQKFKEAINLAKLILIENWSGEGTYLTDPQLEDNGSLFNSKIYDIFLYGSTARKERNPKDIDMAVIDNDYYSRFILGTETYELLSSVLPKLLEEGFMLPPYEVEAILESTPKNNLHLITKSFFDNLITRRNYKKAQSDEKFFQKIFSDILVYNPEIERFIKIKDLLEYLEKRYDCNLYDLKQTA